MQMDARKSPTEMQHIFRLLWDSREAFPKLSPERELEEAKWIMIAFLNRMEYSFFFFSFKISSFFFLLLLADRNDGISFPFASLFIRETFLKPDTPVVCTGNLI